MSDDPEQWSPCPPGELSNLQQSLQNDAKLRARRNFVLAAGAVALAGGGLVTFTQLSSDVSAENITCREALELKSEYQAGTLKLASKRKLIEAHLAHCRRCRIAYDQTA
ncbi:zf-HC2 domain-containing protein [Blastopirellula marina]|uniref:Putative zinc-finger domain-containing protein n=1 Tax=Blastopirellula marina TaxID=124 RepID=A0A2S8FP54_9BACT|nr:zf-HC2 domain-containing protein [Blastopirellula marina]PQO33969.1 hypothetical protein C5Y98_17280 [Blastopirellula marina]PTL43755.1 zf-HC2 domain-containing protein [Blastopirellula marina]